MHELDGAHETRDGMDLPPPLLTRVRIPVPRGDLPRPEVVARIDRGTHRRLTLLTAPAGFGKTTAVVQWSQHHAGRALAWLTLDADDSDRAGFWNDVLHALEPHAPAAVNAAVAAGDVDAALTALVNGLVDAGALVLVLDGLHHAGPEAQADVARLVEHGPPGLRVIATTRRGTALPLAAMRVHDDVAELGIDELAFTRAETAAFLARRSGEAPGPELLGATMERTEGWPGALQLAVAGAGGTIPETISGASRRLADFLCSEVLAGHADGDLDFLRSVSVADRLSGPLCDAMLDRRDSASVLERLSVLEPSLRACDETGTWFALHPLVRDMLRADLARHEPSAGATDLHARAAEWFHAAERPDEAIPHAIAAGDDALASHLVAASWFAHTLKGETDVVLAWLSQFPEAATRRCGRLLLVRAWVMSMLGRRDEAARAIVEVHAHADLDEGPLPDGARSVRSALDLIGACFPWGDVNRGMRCGLRAVAVEDAASPWRAVAETALGWTLFQADAFDDAAARFRDGWASAEALDQPVILSSALAGLSRIEGLHGRRDEQLRLAEDALAALPGVPRWVDSRGEVAVALGAALAAHGRLTDALPLIEQSIRVWRDQGQPLHIVDALLVLAPVRLRAGDREGAQVALAEADAVLRTCADPAGLALRLAALRRTIGAIGAGAAARQDLSERERTVLRMLDSGLSEREIADALYISFNTLHTHVKAIYRKLGVNSRADALSAARRRSSEVT